MWLVCRREVAEISSVQAQQIDGLRHCADGARGAQPGRDAAYSAQFGQETKLPLPTVGKLLRQLSEHGLLSSHRGVNGGYNLAREARSITVAEIILALEGPIGFTECSVVKGLCNMERSCAIMSNSQIIGDALRDALEHVTLSDLNHEMAHHERKHNHELVASIKPAASVAEGVR